MNTNITCIWSPLSGTPTRYLALHGTKLRYLEDTIRHGLHRSTAAWFEFGGPEVDICRRMPDTLALAVEMGLGRRLRNADLSVWSTALSASETPALTVFDLSDEPCADRRYRLQPSSRFEDRFSAPYAKAERAGRGLLASAFMTAATTTVCEIDNAVGMALPQCPVHSVGKAASPADGLRVMDRVPPAALDWNALQAIGVSLGTQLVTDLRNHNLSTGTAEREVTT